VQIKPFRAQLALSATGKREERKTKLIYVSFQTKQNIYLFASEVEKRETRFFTITVGYLFTY